MHLIMLMLECLGTSSNVLLLSIRLLNSSVMAWFQTGLLRVSIGVRGRGSKGTKVLRLNNCLGLEELLMLRMGKGGGLGIYVVRVGVGDRVQMGMVGVWLGCFGSG